MLVRLLAVVLLVAGVWILVNHGFSVPKNHDAKLGPVEVRVQETKRVEMPTWAGVASVAAGSALLLLSTRKK
ncbi:MAG TPA: hypothetical protein VGQ67_00460 [Candidatus Polarisedimenticolia bacterium]|jgi:hypothetical protein|nr:hypothetical protein [Candidatus Polarisedimenticolia bacterium]